MEGIGVCLSDGGDHGGGRGFAVVVVNDEAGAEVDKDVAEDAPGLRAEKADVVCMAEVVDLEGDVEC